MNVTCFIVLLYDPIHTIIWNELYIKLEGEFYLVIISRHRRDATQDTPNFSMDGIARVKWMRVYT